MKNRTRKLLAFLIVSCIAISGCRETADPPEENPPVEEASEELQSDTQENMEAADAVVDTDNTDPANTDPAITEAALPETDSLEAVPDIMQETPSAPMESLEIHTFVGIITDATQYSITAQSTIGNIHHMTIPESGISGNLSSITIGQIVSISYTGSLDENHAALVSINDSQLITGIYVEEYAFAIKIINAVKAMDRDKLAELINFPVFLDTGGEKSETIKDMSAFKKIDSEKIFTEDLVERIVNYNLFDLEYTESGFVMGHGGPNITFDVDYDGILGIIGINSTSKSR